MGSSEIELYSARMVGEICSSTLAQLDSPGTLFESKKLYELNMKILLAEDDEVSAEYIRKGLTEQGHVVDWVIDGREALTYCLYNDCDLFIADRMLPGMDGLAIVKALRASGSKLPVIFLTALTDLDDKVEGLLAGGDDYMVKPFHFAELLARITALSRRQTESMKNTVLSVHDLQLDLLARTAQRQGKLIELKQKEFVLLEVLMENSSRVVSKTLILEKVWDLTFDPGTTIVETHISNLRQKIDKPFDSQLINTVRGMGYMIRDPQ